MGSIPGKMLLVAVLLEEVGPAGLLVVESIGTIGLLRLMRLLLVNGPRLLLLLLFLSLSPSWVVVVRLDEDVFCDCDIRITKQNQCRYRVSDIVKK